MPGSLLHDVSPGVLTMAGVPVIYLFVNMRSKFFYVGQTMEAGTDGPDACDSQRRDNTRQMCCGK